MRSVLDLDLSAIHLDRPFGDSKPEAGSAAFSRSRLIDTKEAVENPLAVLGGDARTLIDDLDKCVAVA